MDSYSLIDTALKIGLGALITGVATYQTAKLNANKTKDKFILEHRVKTIELAAEKIEEYFEVALNFASKVEAITRKFDPTAMPPVVFSEQQWKIVKENDPYSQESREARSFAIARFRLIGADKVVEAFINAHKSQASFRNNIMVHKKTPLNSQTKSHKAEIVKLRSDVQKEINKYYLSACS